MLGNPGHDRKNKSMSETLLAIDQGTTSTRAILFGADGAILATAQKELTQHYPRDGWVEHDPKEIWSSTLAVCGRVLEETGETPVAAGITNQRETTLIWDRETGEPIHRAIVWQDRRGAGMCRNLEEAGAAPTIRERTGLLVDSYFSATKIKWLLDNVDGAHARAEAGKLAFGTVDSFLLWRLTGGRVHATDATNASRTMLFNIHEQRWDPDLLSLFDLPESLLPEVKDSAGDFGSIDESLLGVSIPVAGIAGDQQAATIGQACFERGMVKSTYGTGCFVVMNMGSEAPLAGRGLLTTVAYRVKGETAYALEGSIFNAGTTVKWLRDNLGLIGDVAETDRLAQSLPDNRGVYFVPAFTGLGAPHWDPEAQGAIFGLTRNTGAAELVRAALESVCYQTADLLHVMAREADGEVVLRVDGGMAANDWLLQFLADILGVPVERPRVTETTALGAAYLAGLHAGLYDSLGHVARQWSCEMRFEPKMKATTRSGLLERWRDLVERVRERR
jgi:glycerol kinase